MSAAIDVTLAGRVAVASRGQEGTETALGSKARVALAYLALERWRPVPRDELAEVVWGAELPPTWRAALRGVISRVRGALGAAGLDSALTLTTGPGGYRLRLPAGSTVDVEVAERAVEAARAAIIDDPGRARDEARRAVEILRGEFLAGISGPWVERRQAEQVELHLEGLEVLSQACAACGDGVGAVRAANVAVALQPLRESAHLRVMAAHEAAGNRGRALRAYERCRRVLVDELGITPGPETEAAYLAMLSEEPPEAPSRPRGRCEGNLAAPLTRFVGRAQERSEVTELLGSRRLLTLTGPGGAGKSRLGLEVARTQSGDHPDGVWLLELAGLADPRLLPDQMRAVLGAADLHGCPTIESVVAHVGGKRLLLVLDNCEHLLAACASLVDILLRSCPGLRVLATSREPLHVEGETVWVTPPLSSPSAGDCGSLQSLLRFDAVALFVDRARSAAPQSDLDAMADAVADICRRLEGIPLAIELAAARARTMAIPDIAERLGDRFRLLVGGVESGPARHHTLRAALDWSYDALTDAERQVFVGVSVFAGDFTLDAAEAVCADAASDVIDTLSRLVDKSLVLLTDRTRREGRYRLLETMRQYGGQMLIDIGRDVGVRRRQLQWAAALSEAAEQGLDGPEQARWLQALDAEHDNLRGALDWATTCPTDEHGPRTAAALWRYWEIRGFLGEGRARLEALLAADVGPALRAKMLNAAGVLAQAQSDLAGARAFYEQALAIRRGLDDLVGVAAALNGLGSVAVGDDDLFHARSIFEQNLAASRELGDARLIAASLMNLGVVAQLLFVSGRIERASAAVHAEAMYLESLSLYQGLGDRRGVSQALENLGAIAPYRGDDASAHACLEESLVLRRQMSDKSGIAASARFLGHLALRDGRYGAARSLHEECLAIESELGNRMLMVADLTSLAQIAHGEGNQVEARRFTEAALALSDQLGHTGIVQRVWLNLMCRDSDRRTGAIGPGHAAS